MSILYMLTDIMGDIYNFLADNSIFDVSLLHWSAAFIITNMAISIFWKGAHG